MAVQGSTAIEVEGSTAAVLVVAGAPKPSDDLAINEAALTKCGFTKNAAGVWTKAGGGAAPEAAAVER